MSFRAKTSRWRLLHSFSNLIMCSFNCCYNGCYSCCCIHLRPRARLTAYLHWIHCHTGLPFPCLITRGTRFCSLFEFPDELRHRNCWSARRHLPKIRGSKLWHGFKILCLLLPPGIWCSSVRLLIWWFEINIELWSVDDVIPSTKQWFLRKFWIIYSLIAHQLDLGRTRALNYQKFVNKD